MRLGVQSITFREDEELLFHKTTPANTANKTFTNNTNFNEDVVWKVESLDFDGANARRQKNCVGESFEDANNDGIRNDGENYLDEDGDDSYTADLRQCNFPGQVPTADKTVSGGMDSNNFNRPAVYVRDKEIVVEVKMGVPGKSDISGGNAAVGYPISSFPIFIRPKFDGQAMNGVEGQTAWSNIRNISPASSPYTLKSAAKLANTVGVDKEDIEFEFWYNATGESFVDANGNGAFDAGETLINDNGNGTYDEALVKIPGGQQTEHLIYRLAAAPTTMAKAQGGGKLFMKIVDFTCDWASGEQTSEQVFDKIWNTDNFWTSFVGEQGNRHPDNANGFHGVGDPTEKTRTDPWGNAPKCYTYEHVNEIAGQTVDQLLDINSGRCGAWSLFLPAFAGTHGYNLKQLVLEAYDRREKGGVVDYIRWNPYGASNAVNDEIYISDLTARIVFGLDSYVGICVAKTTNGQANPVGNIDIVSPPEKRDYLQDIFNDHAVSYYDANGNNQLDAGENIYDGSYEHAAGKSYASVLRLTLLCFWRFSP